MNAPVRIERLQVTMRGCVVLRIDELDLAPGEVTAVLGPNGAGKTTLLRVCAGDLLSYTGSVRVLGQRLDQIGPLRITELRRQIGYVPQIMTAGGELPLTIREVVAIGRSGRRGLLRPLRREDWRCVDEWIERLELGQVAGSAFTETSGGQQRRALLARAMVQEPRILLLDEPTAHLDLGAREHMVRIIQDLHQRLGLTVVLVCHEIEVLPPGCARVLFLDRGLVQADGPPQTVLTDQRMRALYGGGFRIVHAAGRHAVLPAMGDFS